ncbi:hypothetical protein Y032_0001g357 [Ancylostoma ceylanicum]|uniref:Uncharacterized protein n=1 Tax=Ancylostoma ceylanicum TaxID=53326 RepID=A0A016W4T8_9BILA|nr:hypothetical protein Y032_0001g357 [Ancylostoma ceylanicum]
MDTVASGKSERLRQCFQDFAADQSAALAVPRPMNEKVFTSFQAASCTEQDSRYAVLCGSYLSSRGGAARHTNARSRRCCAALRCPIAAVLCGPQMPDRGGALRPTDRSGPTAWTLPPSLNTP